MRWALGISYLGHAYNGWQSQADGRTVQFPATLLTPFVSSGGIRGSFVLTCDERGKGAKLQRR